MVFRPSLSLALFHRLLKYLFFPASKKASSIYIIFWGGPSSKGDYPRRTGKRPRRPRETFRNGHQEGKADPIPKIKKGRYNGISHEEGNSLLPLVKVG